MASGQTVQVSIEAAIHKSAREFAEEMFRKYDIRVDSLEFDWGHTLHADTGPCNYRITEVRMGTSS